MRTIILLLSLAASLLLNIASAQNSDWNQPLPIDTNLRYGVLDNGLTYYVYPQPGFGTVSMKLVTKVGSIVEEENERGLAHFLEHMTFEGTEYYPEDLASQLLQSFGLHQGSDFNASTGYDDTQFDIKNISSADTSLFLHSLTILSEWASNLTLTDSAIVKQKGIVQEEWRTGYDYSERMVDAMCQTLLTNSQYENRAPIGSMEVIRNLDAETLKAFYHKWYRPDLQAVIVVGDCDPDITVDLIKVLFGEIPKASNQQPRISYDVPHHTGIKYCLFVDREADATPIGLFFQHDKPSKEHLNSKAYYFDYARQQLIIAMLSLRLGEMCLTANGASVSASCDYDDFLVTNTVDALEFSCNAKQGKALQALMELLTEARRAQVHGFSQNELDRAKSYLLGHIHNALEEIDNQHRDTYIDSFVEHFEQGSDLCSMRQSLDMFSEMLQNHCSLDVINQYISELITQDNVSVVIAGPQTDNATYPNEESVKATFNKIFNSIPEKYDDTISDMPLIVTPPSPGKIVEFTTTDSIVYSLKYDNGTRVILLPTNVKNDEILLNASSNGGYIVYGNEHSTALRAMNDVIEYSALGGIPYNELMKRLIGTNLSLVFNINNYEEQFTGNSGKRDLEKMLQLLYLYFTDIRKDEQAFAAYKNALISEYRQSRSNPTAIFTDSVLSTVYPNFAYGHTLTDKELSQINYDEILALYRERVANPGDYVFTLVGNFTVDSIVPLISNYIGSIPDNGIRETATIKSIVRQGTYKNSFQVPMHTPKTSVEMELYAPCSFSVRNMLMTDMLSYAFDILINKEIREKMNSTYGASVMCNLEKYSNQFEFKCLFDTNNEDAKRVYELCREVIDNTLRNGVDEQTFNDIYNQQVNSFYFAINSNSYWAYHLYLLAKGYDYVNEIQGALQDLTVDKFNHFIQSLAPTSDLSTIMRGE